MVKTKKKDMEAWLLNLEAEIGQPIVVSLLIEEGKVEFMNCMPRKRCLDESGESNEETPAVPLEELKQKDYYYSLMDYIR